MDPQDRPQRRRKSVTHYSDDNPSTFTIKRKRGESFQPPPPPARRKTALPTSPVTPNNNNNNNNNNNHTTTTRKRKLRVIPEAPPLAQDTLLAHAVSIEPILPLNLWTASSSATASSALQNLPLIPPKPEWTKVPSAYTGVLLQRRFGSSVVQVPPPAVRCWTPQQQQQQQQSSGEHVAVGDVAGGVVVYALDCRTLPIARLHTAAWKREQERILESKKTISYPNSVQQVTWRDQTIVLQTSLELEIFVVASGKWNEQAVRIVPLNSERVGLWPGKMDVWTTSNMHHHVLWATGGREIDSSIQLTSCCSQSSSTIYANGEKHHKGANGKSKAKGSSTRGGNVDAEDVADDQVEKEGDVDTARNSLLRLCLHAEDHDSCILSVDSIQPAEIQSWTVLTAIWDASLAQTNDSEPTVLAVAWISSENVEIIRCHAPNGAIVARTEGWQLSSSTNTLTTVASTYCHIQQYSRFTFLAGAFKGIKVLDTATLACVQTIGESVSLHGKTVQWQSFEYIRRPQSIGKDEIIRRQKKQEWIERADEVSRRYSDEVAVDNQDDDNDDDYWLIGVPYPYKGPEEMKSTLHVWKRGIPNPIATLQAPAGGCLGFSAQCDRSSGGWKFMCATAEFGEIWELKSSLVSNFAGVMYPVGYQVVDDNIEYVEDEDELDQLAISEDVEEMEEGVSSKMVRGRFVGNSNHDEDLMRALELSLQEQKKKAREDLSQDDQDLIINVIDHDPGSYSSKRIPCNPDMVLVSDDADQHTVPKSPILSPQRRDGFESEVLLELPQTKQVRQKFARMKQQQEALAQSSTVMASASSLSLPPRIKGKRTKVANVEVLLQSCVNPTLRTFMGQRQASWSFGNGCHATKIGRKSERGERATPRSLKEELTEEKSRPVEEKELAMELLFLCPGRSGTLSPNTSQASASSVILNDRREGQSSPEQIPATTRMDNSINIACGACRGRMIIHSCGKREKPVDYEAIENAEREQKEREAEEKKKQRDEKRRAADAKRREERKKKKDDEARLRFEEEQKRRAEVERMQRLEADQFEEAHIQEDEGYEVPQTESPLVTVNDSNDRPSTMHSSSFHSANVEPEHEHQISHAQAYDRFEEPQSNSSYHSVDFGRQDSFRSEVSSIRLETIRIDGAEVKPYQTISGEDALAALAGLADSMAAAVSTEESTPEYTNATSHFMNGSSRQTEASSSAPTWYNREAESGYHSSHAGPTHQIVNSSDPIESAYVYQGSQDRRTAIAQAFLGTFCAGGNESRYSFEGAVPLNSVNYNDLAKSSSNGTQNGNDNKEFQGEDDARTAPSTWEKYQG